MRSVSRRVYRVSVLVCNRFPALFGATAGGFLAQKGCTAVLGSKHYGTTCAVAVRRGKSARGGTGGILSDAGVNHHGGCTECRVRTGARVG